MSVIRRADAGLLPLGNENLSLNSTAQSLNTTSQSADVLHLSVETVNARYLSAATPTQNTGVLLASGVDYWFYGHTQNSSMKLVSVNSTASLVNVQSYGYKGHAAA